MLPYSERVVDAELDMLLASIAAIALEGPKGVGKTATATRRARSTYRLDDSAQRAIVEADPYALLDADPPVLIDEWQHVPAVWDAVRRAVDDGARAGQYLLTGSASPQNPPTHSGAGRIVTLRMRPLALSERGLAAPTVSLAALLSGQRPKLSGRTTLGLAGYAKEIVASGFPGLRALTGRALRAQLDGYLRRIVDRDFHDQGYAVRRPEMLRRWLAAYAAATSTTTSLEKIRNAAAAVEEDVPTKVTIQAYREVLERLWILDAVPGWLPSRNHLARLTQAPKHHLADPALAARLLGIDEGALLHGAAEMSPLAKAFTPRDGTFFGQLFESLVTLSVRVCASAAEARVYHLRTRDGRQEVDLIVERGDHRLVAIETKLSATVTDADVRHLLWLREQLGDDVLDTVIVCTGQHAYRRPDGVGVVPAVLLGP